MAISFLALSIGLNSLIRALSKKCTEEDISSKMNVRNRIVKLKSLSGDKKSDKPIWKEISEIKKQYGMSEYSFHNDVKRALAVRVSVISPSSTKIEIPVIVDTPGNDMIEESYVTASSYIFYLILQFDS